MTYLPNVRTTHVKIALTLSINRFCILTLSPRFSVLDYLLLPSLVLVNCRTCVLLWNDCKQDSSPVKTLKHVIEMLDRFIMTSGTVSLYNQNTFILSVTSTALGLNMCLKGINFGIVETQGFTSTYKQAMLNLYCQGDHYL